MQAGESESRLENALAQCPRGLADTPDPRVLLPSNGARRAPRRQLVLSVQIWVCVREPTPGSVSVWERGASKLLPALPASVHLLCEVRKAA